MQDTPRLSDRISCVTCRSVVHVILELDFSTQQNIIHFPVYLRMTGRNAGDKLVPWSPVNSLDLLTTPGCVSSVGDSRGFAFCFHHWPWVANSSSCTFLDLGNGTKSIKEGSVFLQKSPFPVKMTLTPFVAFTPFNECDSLWTFPRQLTKQKSRRQVAESLDLHNVPFVISLFTVFRPDMAVREFPSPWTHENVFIFVREILPRAFQSEFHCSEILRGNVQSFKRLLYDFCISPKK